MKKTIAILAAALGFAFCASAQNAGTLTIASGGTNQVAAGTTNSTTAFAVSEYDTVGVQVTLKANQAATSTVRVDGFRSIDSTTYETTPGVQYYLTLNGTTAVTVYTNLNVAGVGTLKFDVVNTNASVPVTNLSVIRRVKQVRVSAK